MVRFDIRSGCILGTRSGQRDTILREGYPVVEGVGSFETDYVDIATRLIQPRPHFPIMPDKLEIEASGNNFAIFSFIPTGTSVLINERSHIVDDGIFEFASTLPGSYAISFSLWPYLDKTFEVIVQ